MNMKIKILDCTAFFIKNNEKWEWIVEGNESTTVEDEEVIETLEEIKDYCDDDTPWDLSLQDKESNIINNWLESK